MREQDKLDLLRRWVSTVEPYADEDSEVEELLQDTKALLNTVGDDG